MKRHFLAALAGIGLFLGLQEAHAGFGDTNNVNCGALSGSPLMCVKNQASAPVVGVQAVNLGSMFVDSNWINVPGGPIPSGGTTVVRFPTFGSGCQKLIFVKLATGSTHPFQADVCHMTSLVINGW